MVNYVSERNEGVYVEEPTSEMIITVLRFVVLSATSIGFIPIAVSEKQNHGECYLLSRAIMSVFNGN